MSEVGSPAVLDATVLSNFSSTDAIDVLIQSLPRPVTVPAVQDEIERGYADRYEFLAPARGALDEDIPVVAVSSPMLAAVQNRLDPGEAEALSLASERDGTLVSDDRDARETATEAGVPVTGSLGVLARAILAEHLDVGTADAWLEIWRTEYGYYAPVDSISDVLPDE